MIHRKLSRPSSRTRPYIVMLILALLMALTMISVPAQAQKADEDAPSDAELAAKLEPIVLREKRSGNVATITLEIPVGADTFTTSGKPTTNWSTDPNLRVGFNQSLANGAQRIFLFFDISSIPSNATVQSATLRMFLNGASPSGNQDMPLLARFLNTSWDASILTWNNFNPSWGAEIGIGNVDTATGWHEAPFTDPVVQWVNGTRANNGFMIQGDETPQQRERIFTAINANNGLHPRLVVTYDVIVDTTPPTSTMTALPQWSQGTFTVNWTATDNPGGSGIRHYDVQFRTNGGAWQNWLTATTQTSASFTGTNAVLYDFRVRAVDNANNVEAFRTTPDASTTVDTIPPTATVNPLPPFTFSDNFTVTWGGTDTVSGIAHYDVEYQLNGGPWQGFAVTTTTTSGQVLNATAGQVYGFRARAVDRAGNIQSFPASPQAQTTISLGSPGAAITPFNPPIVTQNTFPVQWTGTAAPGATIVSYDVQFRFNGGPWQTWLTNFGGTTQQFTAQQGDGVYEFQVRARDSAGRVGSFSGGPGSSVAVDAVDPRIVIRGYLPLIADN